MLSQSDFSSRHRRPRLLLLLLVLNLFLFASGQCASPAHAHGATTSTTQSSGLTHRLFHRFQALASPGPLSAVHAAWDQPDGCEKCHLPTKGLSNNLCLNCHEPIKKRLRAKSGYHGTLTGKCETCHSEHHGREHSLIDLDEKRFDHSKARFALSGKHLGLPCEACHAVKKGERQIQKRFFIGLPTRCDGCHVSPHGAEFKQACTACHSTEGWGQDQLKFDHQTQTAFPLKGKHQSVACAECHKGMKVFNQAPTRCDQCHGDPHQGQFSGQFYCTDCHSEEGWRRPALKFDHQSMSSFPLTGRHTQVDCESCHAGMKTFRPLATNCDACHADPHKGQFAATKACTACHQTAGWKPPFLLFNHDVNTRFPLRGRHAGVACAQCHQGGRYHDTPMACASCHADPHQGRLGKSCEQCHSVFGFGERLVKFDHNRQTRFPLTGLHAIKDCKACHADRTFRVAGIQCAACHADAEQFYAGTSFPDRAPPHPDAMHGLVRCEDCHHPSDASASAQFVRPRCIACHTPAYGVYLDEATRLIARRLKEVPPGVARAPRIRREMDIIAREAPHNFIYADQLIEALKKTPAR